MIHNEPKRTVFASGGLGPLQMVSESLNRRCASEVTGPPRGVDCEDPTSVGERNEAFLIRVWKPLPSRHVLKL